jgi:hypothetical protein
MFHSSKRQQRLRSCDSLIVSDDPLASQQIKPAATAISGGRLYLKITLDGLLVVYYLQ